MSKQSYVQETSVMCVAKRLLTYPELELGMGTGTSSAKYSNDGCILGNNPGANFEIIISLQVLV